MNQDPNQELRDLAEQLRRSLTRYDPNDELIKSVSSLADGIEATANGNGGEAIDRWREDYQQNRSSGAI